MSEQDISAEVEELRQQRDQARTEFDSLGPVIERLGKANAHIRADNKHLFQRLREEEALTVKWQQRAEAAEAEAARSRERLVGAHQVENILREELDTATALVPEADLLQYAALCIDGDDEEAKLLKLAADIRAWRGDGREEREGESDGNA